MSIYHSIGGKSDFWSFLSVFGRHYGRLHGADYLQPAIPSSFTAQSFFYYFFFLVFFVLATQLQISSFCCPVASFLSFSFLVSSLNSTNRPLRPLVDSSTTPSQRRLISHRLRNIPRPPLPSLPPLPPPTHIHHASHSRCCWPGQTPVLPGCSPRSSLDLCAGALSSQGRNKIVP